MVGTRLYDTVSVWQLLLLFRLIRAMEAFPWKLAKLYDPAVPQIERNMACTRFLEVRPCCLDPFSAKIRAQAFLDMKARYAQLSASHSCLGSSLQSECWVIF